MRAELAPLNVLGQLSYFVHWRPRLWTPAVRWLIGDPARFRGTKVLEVGCRTGRLSCLFGLLGAEVLGVDLPAVGLEPAWQEAARWGVSDRVRFLTYGGDPSTLPEGDFDFVVTKSVLVMIRELERFLGALSTRMRPGGELLAAENVAGGRLLNFVRRTVIHRGRTDNLLGRFRGVDHSFLATLGGAFEVVGHRRFFWLVSALRARPR
jgi:SAM-dependent methyltransferase